MSDVYFIGESSPSYGTDIFKDTYVFFFFFFFCAKSSQDYYQEKSKFIIMHLCGYPIRHKTNQIETKTESQTILQAQIMKMKINKHKYLSNHLNFLI